MFFKVDIDIHRDIPALHGRQVSYTINTGIQRPALRSYNQPKNKTPQVITK
jgi:hypothetical protein